MNTLTVTLPDGTTDSRKTDRNYTHAITVTITEASRTLALAPILARIAAQETTVATASPNVGRPEQVAAYEAAKAQLAHLDEQVTEPSGFQCARWLSREFRDQVASPTEPRMLNGHARGDVAGKIRRDAEDALLATARGALEDAEARLVWERVTLERAEAHHVVGKSYLFGWSQSAKSAVGQVKRAMECYPSASVVVVTDVQVHTPKSRKVGA